MSRERQIKKNEQTRKAILDTVVTIGLEEVSIRITRNN